MSRTRKKTPPPGLEYWKSRLHRHGETPGRYTKQLTARKERRASRKEIDESRAQYDDREFQTDIDFSVMYIHERNEYFEELDGENDE